MSRIVEWKSHRLKEVPFVYGVGNDGSVLCSINTEPFHQIRDTGLYSAEIGPEYASLEDAKRAAERHFSAWWRRWFT